MHSHPDGASVVLLNRRRAQSDPDSVYIFFYNFLHVFAFDVMLQGEPTPILVGVALPDIFQARGPTQIAFSGEK